MKTALVFKFFGFFICLTPIIFAFNVCVTNGYADMMSSKKICARLSFDPDESALYRETLCISVDSPDIELKGWRTITQAPTLYVAGFKKTKRLFTEAFSLEILIDFEKPMKSQNLFDHANLCISSLVLMQMGNSKAGTVVVSLNGANNHKDSFIAMDYPSESSTVSKSRGLSLQKSFDFFNRNKVKIGKKEINEVLIIDRMKGLWRDIRVNMGAYFCSFSFYKWYLILWAFFLWIVLGWFYPRFGMVYLSGRRFREVFIFVTLLLLLFTWWLVRNYIASSVWYGALSILCIPGAFYYLWGGSETFFDRFKVMIGIFFAVMLLPLFALACIHENFELLKFFL